jgi:negative modulator of initiation of replication
MKTIEIEDDVYQFLLRNITQIGESASEILRRLLGIPGEPTITISSIERLNTELLKYLNGDDFNTLPSVVDKFLSILSYVYQKDPQQFKKVLEISGKRRKYFALSRKELEESGRSVYPKQIPNSPFWVVTNNDTPKKRRMLRDVLNLLGYSQTAIKQAVEKLV